ncbi:MAG: sigma-70 family RNA polymerase sigma factor, partial [Planctomycetota bacterium]
MTQADPLREADVHRHQRFLEALARDVGGGEDAVQDTWLRVLQRRSRRGHSDSEGMEYARELESASRGWLASVLRSRAIDGQRARRRQRIRERSTARPEAMPDSLQPLLEAEEAEELNASLMRLPRDDREAVQLRYLDQVQPREFARRTGQPVHLVYRQLERGRSRLRADLSEEARFSATALAPVFAARRADLLAMAALSWKPLAVVGAVALLGGAWRATGVPPSTAAPDASWTLISDDPAASVTDALDVEIPASQPETRRAQVESVPENRENEPTSTLTGRLEMTVLLGTQGDASGIEALFIPRPEPSEPSSESLEIELPSSGRVKVDLHAGRVYDLTLRSPLSKGLEPIVVQRVPALDPGQVRAWTVEIPGARLRTFSATVVQAEDGLALPTAQVLADEGGRILAQSDASGRVQFDVPREGLGVVSVRADGFGPVLIDTENEGRAEQDEFVIELERAASLLVRGSAELAQEPAPPGDSEVVAGELIVSRVDDLAYPLGSRLGVESWRQSSVREGSDLRFNALPPDVPLTLELKRGETLLHRSLEPLVLEAGEQRILNLHRDSHRYLTGHLMRPSGESVAGCEIWLLRASADAVKPWRILDEHAQPLLTVRTDARGAFEFPNVPEGSWWLGPAPGQEDLAPYARLHFQDGALQTRVHLEAIPP